MTFNQIKYFITVAKCLSFTEAAKYLFITQPALSRQISAMEEELNTQLFIRSKKTLKLTPGGVILYNNLPGIMKQFNDSIDLAKSANQGMEGQLRLGFLDVYDITDLIPPVIQKFQEIYPNIQVSMERYSLGELPQRLQEDQLDMILTYGFSLFDKPDILVENVAKFESCIMMPLNHPLAKKADLKLQDFENETFAVLNPAASEEGHNYIIRMFEKGGISPKLKMVDSMADTLLWVETGCCVAITTNRTIASHNQMVTFWTIPGLEKHDTALAWRKNNYNPAISLFLKVLHEQ